MSADDYAVVVENTDGTFGVGYGFYSDDSQPRIRPQKYTTVGEAYKAAQSLGTEGGVSINPKLLERL